MRELKECLLAQLQLLDTVLSSLNHQDYSKPSRELMGASIGKHVRHITDMWMCLLDHTQLGDICYDKRNRDPETEVNPAMAREIIHGIIQRIHTIESDMPMTLTSSLQSEFPVRCSTSLIRELLFQLDHSVHHMAMIRAALESHDVNYTIPVDFGYALSTLKHQTAG